MTKEELEFQIATEQAFIKKQRAAQDRMRTQNSGVRSSSISADLAAFDLTIFNAKDRIAEHENQQPCQHGCPRCLLIGQQA